LRKEYSDRVEKRPGTQAQDANYIRSSLHFGSEFIEKNPGRNRHSFLILLEMTFSSFFWIKKVKSDHRLMEEIMGSVSLLKLFFIFKRENKIQAWLRQNLCFQSFQ